MVLPATGEYVNYTTYSVDVPVARTTVPDAASSIVSPDSDVVMCLSCHMAHASNYSDMLRWKYSGADSVCKAGVPNADCGCFTCHSEKD